MHAHLLKIHNSGGYVIIIQYGSCGPAPNLLYYDNKLTATGVATLARSTVTVAISYQDNIKAVHSEPLSVIPIMQLYAMIKLE